MLPCFRPTTYSLRVISNELVDMKASESVQEEYGKRSEPFTLHEVILQISACLLGLYIGIIIVVFVLSAEQSVV